MSPHRFPYRWTLAPPGPPVGPGDAHGYPARGIAPSRRADGRPLQVFSTFACGGGSTMGYKLAGYHVLGCLEIDPQVIEVYRANHHPELSFCDDIRAFRVRPVGDEHDQIPEALFDLDVLDGSPPCSTFSTSGNREGDWGKSKAFREGQAVQRLDDLFAEFVALAARLQPRVVVAENVRGMMIGKAKGYCREVVRDLQAAGYHVQMFFLNAATMGVPQRRERVFFVGRRRDLRHPDGEAWGPLALDFDEPPIPYRAIREDGPARELSDAMRETWWRHRKASDLNFSDITRRRAGINRGWNRVLVNPAEPLNTITAAAGSWLVRRDAPCEISLPEILSGGTFPRDYDFDPGRTGRGIDPKYLVGMSVPPVMVAQIATAIRNQWFDAQPVEA